MFYGCYSLKEINYSNIKSPDAETILYMFYFIPNELRNKIKEQVKNFKFG